MLSGDGGWLCKGGVRLRSGSFLLKKREKKNSIYIYKLDFNEYSIFSWIKMLYIFIMVFFVVKNLNNFSLLFFSCFNITFSVNEEFDKM